MSTLTAEGKPVSIECSDDVVQARETIEKKAPLLEPKAARVASLAGELASLTAQGQVLGDAWPDAGKTLWSEKQQELRAAHNELMTLQSQVAEALGKVSVVEQSALAWPTHGEERGPVRVPVATLTNEQIAKWGVFDEETARSLKAATPLWVWLTSASPIARTKPCLAGATPDRKDKECNRDAQAGLKYRVPAVGELVLCMQCEEEGDGACKATVCPAEKTLARVSAPISQLGPVFTLPLKSAVFTNKSVTAVFDEQGRPLELGVVSSAAAEEAVTTAASVTDTVLKARESVVSTRLERLKEETEILKAEKELAAAKKALEAPTEAQEELVALQADTALLNARLANLEAQAALQKAQQLGDP